MLIKNISFISNSALNSSSLSVSGIGGGFYYTCSSLYNCKVAMHSENIFINNLAENAGGGIKWDDLEPVFE